MSDKLASDSSKANKNVGSKKDEKTQKSPEEIDKETKKLRRSLNVSFLSFWKNIRKWFKYILDIREGSDPEKTREAIIHDIEFRGANVWSLIASIIIASIGLNMNSTAVVIGAMLISPLMGPIIGIGYSIAINDLSLLIKAIKNFAVMVILSIITSTLYFWASPLNAPSAELIGRTQPTLLDMFVAIFGGIAGIVSISKSERTNVIPGVAIATALIPPLCTSGYGIATGNLSFFIGASYLFLINSVFISLASFAIIRYLKFPFRKHVDQKRAIKVKRVMIIFSILVMIPSAYTFWGAIKKFNFQSQANAFIKEVCVAPNSKIIKTEFSFKKDTVNYIDLYMIGSQVDTLTINTWKADMQNYKLDNTQLRIYQNTEIQQQNIAIDDLERNVKTGIIEELYQRNQQVLVNKDERINLLETELAKYKSSQVPYIRIDGEVKSLEPYVLSIALGENYFMADSNHVDTVYSMLIKWDDKIKNNKAKKKEISDKLANWLKVRINKDSVIVVNIN